METVFNTVTFFCISIGDFLALNSSRSLFIISYISRYYYFTISPSFYKSLFLYQNVVLEISFLTVSKCTPLDRQTLSESSDIKLLHINYYSHQWLEQSACSY